MEAIGDVPLNYEWRERCYNLDLMDEAVIVLVTIGIVLALMEVFHRYRVERLRKRILRNMLTDERWSWRTIEALHRAIGLDPGPTRELLIKIGARASVLEKEVWTLEK